MSLQRTAHPALRQLSLGAGVVAGVLGLLGLLGSYIGVDPLSPLGPAAPVPWLSAIGLIVGAVGAAALQRRDADGWTHGIRVGAGLLLPCLAALAQLHPDLGPSAVSTPGTRVGMVLIGLGLLLRTPWRLFFPPVFLGALAIGLGTAALILSVAHGRAAGGLGPLTVIGTPVALGLALLGLAVAVARNGQPSGFRWRRDLPTLTTTLGVVISLAIWQILHGRAADVAQRLGIDYIGLSATVVLVIGLSASGLLLILFRQWVRGPEDAGLYPTADRLPSSVQIHIRIIAVLASLAVATAAIAFTVLYEASLRDHKEMLVELVDSHTHLIDAIARFDAMHSQTDVEGGAAAATLGQVIHAYTRYSGLGQTGELVVGRVQDGAILFVTPSRKREGAVPDAVPFDVTGDGTAAAEPMRLALRGETGLVTGLDYAGDLVIAAYGPLAGVEAGLVAKMDVSEIRTPFLHATLAVGFVAMALVLVGVLLNLRSVDPLLGRIYASHEALRSREVELREARDRAERFSRDFDHFLESTSDLVYMKDRDLRFVAASRPLTEMFGYRDWHELVGRTEEEILTDASAIRFRRDPERAVIDGGEVVHAVEDIIERDGERGWVDTVKKPLTDTGGQVVGILSISRDITELKRTQDALEEARGRAEEATQAKSDFLANMSHEIRTPMNAILGMSYLVQRTELSSQQSDYLAKIETAAQNLLHIINDILDFSKIEAGRMELETIDFELDSVLDNVSTVAGFRLRDKPQLEFHFSVSPDVPRSLRGDSLRLGQVITNLVTNAIKFTETGEVVLAIELEEKTEADAWLHFSVRDTGLGLTQEQLGRLFHAFTQADTSTTREYGGTGLGLTISQSLVEMMGGRIWAESEHGVGSTFHFTARLGLAATQARLESEALHGLDVLVVDDSDTARAVLETMLGSFGFRCHSVASGAEALAACERAARDGAPYRLVLMDWKMPGMSGIEATRKIRARFGAEASPKVVMVTAYGREEVIREATEAHLDGFLVKPIHPSQLFNTIVEIFQPRAAAGGRRSGADTEAAARRHLAGRRVLVVEDNEVNQQIARELLEAVGLQVDIANDGRQGVERVESDAFDAVLMDIQMPVMDGLAATRQIRTHGGALADLPIVAMTAHAMESDRQLSLEAGMTSHVTKPIDPAELYRTLVSVLAGQDLGPEAGAEPEAGEADTAFDVPGWDTKTALQRVAGNETVYLELLQGFLDKQPGVPAQLRGVLAAGQTQAAVTLCHTLKGVAGNLGAVGTFAAARDVEMALRDGREDAGAVDALTAALDADLTSLRDALRAREAAGGGGTDPVANLAPEQAADLMRRLLQLLADNDMEAEDIVRQLQPLTGAQGDLVARIAAAVENWDFDAALPPARELARAVGAAT